MSHPRAKAEDKSWRHVIPVHTSVATMSSMCIALIRWPLEAGVMPQSGHSQRHLSWTELLQAVRIGQLNSREFTVSKSAGHVFQGWLGPGNGRPAAHIVGGYCRILNDYRPAREARRSSSVLLHRLPHLGIPAWARLRPFWLLLRDHRGDLGGLDALVGGRCGGAYAASAGLVDLGDRAASGNSCGRDDFHAIGCDKEALRLRTEV
jgi:hypothetical protein